ncbi:LacI family DNA-binding transcriptional regulator [Plebeiibacterium marinum]|uniref:LacI family transcriptional regulator n=1 Tax=Plebeiibacterium marinum TaxID=2992111 RepID=A0AAE3SL30_9BACT|nr:LacI family DNA-binding transcriptional regulator [Plebeiobacterium marinum]MCW3806140.1 LacI family transcriptional regulator [Plebeiobacterium marinum]
MKVSIRKIAELAGVSKTTVSFVLNNRGDEKNISSATQEKILAIVKDHNYKPNQLARSLSLGKTNTIGFVVPDISDPFYGKIAKHIDSCAEERFFKVMIANSHEDKNKESELINNLISRQIDGIILASTQVFESNKYKGVPLVYFDRISPNQKDSFIDINNQYSTEQITKLLIKRGHSKIGFISLTSYLPNIQDRITGYKNALIDSGFVTDENNIIDIDYNNKKESVVKALKTLLCTNNCTGIVFVNNVLAAEGVWALNTYFSELIEKVEFACFDNLDLFDYSLPKVTSVVQPIEDIAKNCLEMLCDQIDNSIIHKGKVLKTTIIER